MHIKPTASTIHPFEFREWRLTGQAFDSDGSTCTMLNQTLSKSRVDITTGPFISIGTDCDRTDDLANKLFDVHHKGTGAEKHMHSATDVAFYNVTSFMWTIATGKKYQMTTKGVVFSGIGTEEQPSISSPKKRFSIVPITSSKPLFRKPRFNGFFDTAFITNTATSILEDERFFKLLRDDASLIVETCRFELTKNDSHTTKSIANLRDVLSGNNAVEMANEEGGACVDDLLTFRRRL